MRGNPRPVAQPGGQDSLQQWYADLPIVTKILFTGTFLQGAMVSFGIINPANILMIWDAVTSNFEIWRIFTNFMYAGKFSFPFAMHLYVLYENSLNYERNPFNTGAGGSSADYLYMIVIGMGILLVVDYMQPMFALSEPLLYMIMYVWSRKSPDELRNIFGFQFKSLYLPWVYIAIRMIMGGDIVSPLFGIGTGHMYFFLIEVLPGTPSGDTMGNLIRTPQWAIRLVEIMTARTHPRFPASSSGASAGSNTTAARGGQAAGANPTPPQNRYNWGRGQTLGRN